MADVQAQVQQQLDQFKAQVHEAAQQVSSLEELMTQVEAGFTKLEADIEERMGQLNTMFGNLEPMIQEVTHEFQQEYDALLALCQKAEGEFHDDAATIEQDCNQFAHEMEDYVHAIEEHDHTVEQHVQDAANKAQEVINKAKSIAEHVVDTGVHTATTVVHGVESAAKSVEHGVEQVVHTVQQGISTAVQGLLGHGNDIGSLVRAQAQHLGEGLQNQDAQLESEMQNLLHQLEAGTTEHLDKLIQEVEQMEHAITAVSETVTQLTTSGVDSIGIMTSVAEATNVGLNTVVGSVKDVKEILDEVGL